MTNKTRRPRPEQSRSGATQKSSTFSIARDQIGALFERLVDADRETENDIILGLARLERADNAARIAAAQRLAHTVRLGESLWPPDIRRHVQEIDSYLASDLPQDMKTVWRTHRQRLVGMLYRQRPRQQREDLPDILALASQHTELRRRGRQWWGLCPKHEERSPSFSVNPEKQAWYCWHDHVGGGPAQFLDFVGAA